MAEDKKDAAGKSPEPRDLDGDAAGKEASPKPADEPGKDAAKGADAGGGDAGGEDGGKGGDANGGDGRGEGDDDGGGGDNGDENGGKGPEVRDPLNNDFIEADLVFWRTVTDEDRAEFYTTAQTFFHATLEEWRNAANESVRNFKIFQGKHSKWRVTLICVTGGLAILNVLAANNWPGGDGEPLNRTLSLVAAVYASILALLTTLEGFFNYPDQKTTTRESRELYLDAYRTHEMMWLSRVFPFGYSPEGCFNACVVYRQLIAKDIELRRKIIDLTEIEGRAH